MEPRLPADLMNIDFAFADKHFEASNFLGTHPGNMEFPEMKFYLSRIILTGHALELLLKGFIRASEKEPQRVHDLRALLDSCKQICSGIILTEKDEEVVGAVNELWDKPYRARYMLAGVQQYPVIQDVSEAYINLRKSLYDALVTDV